MPQKVCRDNSDPPVLVCVAAPASGHACWPCEYLLRGMYQHGTTCNTRDDQRPAQPHVSGRCTATAGLQAAAHLPAVWAAAAGRRQRRLHPPRTLLQGRGHDADSASEGDTFRQTNWHTATAPQLVMSFLAQVQKEDLINIHRKRSGSAACYATVVHDVPAPVQICSPIRITAHSAACTMHPD